MKYSRDKSLAATAPKKADEGAIAHLDCFKCSSTKHHGEDKGGPDREDP